MKEGVAQQVLDEIELDEQFYIRVAWIRAIAVKSTRSLQDQIAVASCSCYAPRRLQRDPSGI